MFRIKEVLKEKNMTSIALADSVDVASNTIARINSGVAKPSIELLEKISQTLDVDIRELFKPGKGYSLLNGFVEYKNTIYRIETKEDLETLLDKIN